VVFFFGRHSNVCGEAKKDRLTLWEGSSAVLRVKTFSRQPRILWVSVSLTSSSFFSHFLEAFSERGSRSSSLPFVRDCMRYFVFSEKPERLKRFREFFCDLMVQFVSRCDVKDIEKGIFEFFSYLFLLSRSIARVSS
jgi:hypothetical protein